MSAAYRAALKSAFASVGTRQIPGLTDEIYAVVFDTDDTFFVATHNALYAISANGTRALVCGDPASEPGFVDGTGNQVRLNSPCRMMLFGDKKLVLSEPDNHALRMVFLETGTVKTIVGNGVAGVSVDVTNESAQLNCPTGICQNADGLIYIADTLNHRIMILRIPDDWPNSEIHIDVFCGVGLPGHVDGIYDISSFDGPIGLQIDHDSNLIVADEKNNCIRSVCECCGFSKTITGKYADAVKFRDGPVESARFSSPVDVVVDDDNSILVADRYNHCLRMIKSNGQKHEVVTLAGRRSVLIDDVLPLELQSIDGLSKRARFNFPRHLCFNNSGQLVVVCNNNNGAIRVVSPRNSSFAPP